MPESVFNEIFARNLRKQLDRNNMSQVELAKKLGVSPQSVTNWCKGIKLPRMDKVDAMCKILCCSRSDLMQENTEQAYYINPETAEMAQAIFENKELRILFDAAKDAAPEDLQALQSMLIALKRKERGGDDG